MRVYCVTHISSGKRYVGKTTTELAVRWAAHCRSRQDTLLAIAIRKHGAEAFAVEEVATASSDAELNELERLWIARLVTLAPGGFNMMPGGEGGPHSEVTIRKLKRMAKDPAFKERQRVALKAYWSVPANRARLLEHCALMRSLKTGKTLPPRRPWTAAQRARHSEQRKKMWRDPKYRATVCGIFANAQWRAARNATLSKTLRSRK